MKFAVKSIKSGMPSGRAESPTRSKSLSKSPTCSFSSGLDEQEIAEELKANREKKPMQKRFFPEGKDSKKRPYQDFRWNRFKNLDPREMYTVVSEHVFPLAADSGRQRHDLLEAHGGRALHHPHARAAG